MPVAWMVLGAVLLVVVVVALPLIRGWLIAQENGVKSIHRAASMVIGEQIEMTGVRLTPQHWQLLGVMVRDRGDDFAEKVNAGRIPALQAMELLEEHVGRFPRALLEPDPPYDRLVAANRGSGGG